MEKKYSITLANGVCLENLSLNGNNYISNEDIDESVFEGNLSTVVISDGERTRTHKNMELVHLAKADDGKCWFIIRDIPKAKMETLRLQADVEYIAMMTGIKL